MGKDVIIACDFACTEETIRFLDKFNKIREGVVACDDISVRASRPYVKIGMELFYAEGPQIIRILKERGHKVFLDLKLHDIPNTVGKAMQVIGGYGVDMVNVHAAGSIQMMEAAKHGLMLGAIRFAEKPKLIAVTQLTSIDEETLKNELLIDKPLDEVVAQYALNAKKAGLDGVVCSAHEVVRIHELCGEDFITVTPGIRFEENAAGDQKRIMTPAAAKEVGSDYIVMGRPITASDKPVEVYRKSCEDFK
ncbi:MAG TPA: orotidine-5'-phosphate decarboxylase [Mogibacterium sp.]|nr:orotidine-5'-phosphate decarboxylase [Mogibacterium sp.]